MKLTLRFVRQFRGTMRREVAPERVYELDGSRISDAEAGRLIPRARSVERGPKGDTYEIEPTGLDQYGQPVMPGDGRQAVRFYQDKQRADRFIGDGGLVTGRN